MTEDISLGIFFLKSFWLKKIKIFGEDQIQNKVNKQEVAFAFILYKWVKLIYVIFVVFSRNKDSLRFVLVFLFIFLIKKELKKGECVIIEYNAQGVVQGLRKTKHKYLQENQLSK